MKKYALLHHPRPSSDISQKFTIMEQWVGRGEWRVHSVIEGFALANNDSERVAVAMVKWLNEREAEREAERVQENATKT